MKMTVMIKKFEHDFLGGLNRASFFISEDDGNLLDRGFSANGIYLSLIS